VSPFRTGTLTGAVGQRDRMDLPVRRETIIFAALVAFLGWWQLDLPPLQRAAVTAVAVAAFVAVSYGIERWRRQQLGEYLDAEE
jgi:hypothetical protein